MVRSLILVPDREPMPAPPDDYQRIQSSPDMFGGTIGRAMERGGAELRQAGDQITDRANEINADRASYDFQDKAQKLLYGDPSNPDPNQRLGLRQLRGQDALDAYPRVRDQLKSLYDAARKSLGNPMAQLEFDRSTRRLFFNFNNEAGAHYDAEWKTYGATTQQAGQAVARQGVLAHAEDEEAAQNFGGDWIRAAVREQQVLHGDNLPPEIVNATIGKVRGEITAARIDGLIAQGKSDVAAQLFDRDKGLLSEHDLSRLRPLVDRQAGKADADRLWSGQTGGIAGGVSSAAGDDVGARIAGVWRRRGWSDAAIIGGLNSGITESGLAEWGAPDAAGERGIFQFHPDTHLPAFRAAYGGDRSAEAQANYVADVVQQTMPGYAQIGDASAATTRFTKEFERPKDQSTEALAARGGNTPRSQAILARFGETGASGSSQAPRFDLAFGDSIAVQQIRHGVTGKEGARGGDQTGATAVIGDTPQQVLSRMQAAGADAFAGKTVFLSPGTSNNPAQLDAVQQQVDFLKSAGARAVAIPGVGPGVANRDQVNARLRDIAGKAGFTFFEPAVKWQADGIHPAEVDKLRDQARQALAASSQGPSAGSPVASAAALAPDRIDHLVADVEDRAARGEISPERAQATISELTRKYHHWIQATAGDRAAMKQSIAGGIQILASGRDYDVDENQIRRLFPADEADHYLTLLDDAKVQGQAMRSVAGSTPEELAQTRAKLQADLDLNLNPADFAKRSQYATAFERAAEHRLAEVETQAGQEAVTGLRTAPVPAEAAQGKLSPEDLKEFAQGSPEHAALAQRLGNYPSDVDVQRRQRLLEHFDAAIVQHYKALATDPASYVASWNPPLQAKAEIAAKATDPDQARQAFASYAADILGLQEHLGLRPEQQHVLGVPQARAIVQDLTSNPENAPARFRGMAARFGDYWPKVWADLSTIGKLPGAWQLVSQLADYDPENAGLLARQLSQQPGKDQRESALKERPGTGAKSIEAQIAEAVDGDDRVRLFDRSLANGFVSEAARNEITGAVHALAKARYLYAGEDPSTAAARAVDAAIGHYEFDPRSMARAPADRFDAISANARATLDRVLPASIAIPPGFGGGAQPTPEDYVAQLKSAGLWVNAPRNDSWWLVDQAGRFVLDRDGNHIAVPFGVAALPIPKSATPFLPSPVSPF